MIAIENYKKIGVNSFRIGIFLLPSAPFIASLLLLISIVNSFFYERLKIIKDKKDYLFIISSLLLLLVSIHHYFNFEDINFIYRIWDSRLEINRNTLINNNPYSSFIGLSNWIPLFLCFFGFQPYLRSSNERKIILKLLIAGTVPVLISGYGQIYLGWHKPLEMFNGLIIWFQKPNSHIFSGLFNNQNYAGCWLNITWPISIAFFYEKTKNIFKKATSLIFILSIFLASFLTFSRNAWGGLFLSIPLVLGPITFYWLLFFAISFIFIVSLKSFNFLPDYIINLLNSILPAKLNIFEIFMDQFSSNSYPDPANSRKTIFSIASKMILEKPFIGWGAAAFPIYYGFKTSIFISHAHNLIIDTAFNYGLIITILIFANISMICLFSFKKIYLSKIVKFKENYFERSWWTAFFILLCSQMFDVQYYDLRISIAFWLLLSGLRCIIYEDRENIIYTN